MHTSFWHIVKTAFAMRPSISPALITNRHPLGRRLGGFTTVALLCAALTLSPAKAEIFDQYQVKAVFLLNLANFVSWPDHHAASDIRPFTIAVMGRNNLAPYLERAVADESIAGRKVVLQHFKLLKDLEAQPCDLLFVSEDQMSIWPQIRAIVRGRAIMTVSDVEGFTHRGGMVGLLTSGRKINIEINRKEAKGNGLEISAKLLRLARIVDSGKEER